MRRAIETRECQPNNIFDREEDDQQNIKYKIIRMKNTQEKQQEDSDESSNSNNNQARTDDQKSTRTSSSTNKEATTDDPKPKTTSKKVKYHPDPCSICFEFVDLLDLSKYSRHICCGKVLHNKCNEQIYASDLRNSIKHSCPMCRSKNAPVGSKEEIKRLREWVQRGRSWAQLMLGERYRDGVGVTKDRARQLKLCTSR